jgi:hypothetical protein
VLPGPADIFPPPAEVVGSLEAPGRGRPEVVVLEVEEAEGSPEAGALVDGRTIVLATVSAGVDAALDLRVEVVVRLEGEAPGAIDILPEFKMDGLNEVVVGRVGSRFVCPAPSAPNALDEEGTEGRVTAGRAV